LPESQLFVFDQKIDHPLGIVRDLTPNGCKLESTYPVKVGKIFDCRLDLPEPIFGIGDLHFLGQVRWCQESETPDIFELGLEFQSLTERERFILSLLIVPWENAKSKLTEWSQLNPKVK
jgi:hypothetical protein